MAAIRQAKQLSPGAVRKTLALLLLLPAMPVYAEQTELEAHKHHQVDAIPKPAPRPAADARTKPAASAMHTQTMPAMDHSHMDHSKMNHADMPGMADKQTTIISPHAGHGPTTAMDGMQHSSHSTGATSTELRNPHAFADGYDFGPFSHTAMGDEEKLSAVLVDRFESVTARGSTAMTYDWQAWYGQTYDKALFRAEGEIDDGQFKDARNELLWAHAVSAYWDTQLGVRYDSGKGVDRGWLAFGVQGLAPYWIYVEATGYVNEQGRTAFRLETEYDLLITQKLILQPRVETNFYSQRDDSRAVSSGLSNIEAGLRLRYEIRREIAPYLGVEWASRFGSAAQLIRAAGQHPDELRLVAGIHLWF
ncbi:MAG: copper resistance protein B [Methylococcales bacterium]